ncbi:MAG TPA: hypothetical protein VGQ00_01605 [Candidatus Norongarragalinales archaeon]|jgi:hypothetical protein|nr:hypothetical protein [Candidatus Norongarragalinales archaeon]
MKSLPLIILAFFVIAFTGCVNQESPLDVVEDNATLVRALQSVGADVVLTNEAVSHSYMPIAGRKMLINKQTTEMYQFRSYEEAVGWAKKFTPDARVVNLKNVTWTATPHVFRRDKLIVIYEGDDVTVTGNLTRVMNPQFAGQP